MTFPIPILGEFLRTPTNPDVLVGFLTDVIDFKDWIGKIGGIVAFVGAVKLGISFRAEDEREAIQAALTILAGFMIKDAVNNTTIFTVTGTAASEFADLLSFASGWVAKAGAVGVLYGGIQFGLAMKDNNAPAKVMAIKGMITGVIVTAVAGTASTFI